MNVGHLAPGGSCPLGKSAALSPGPRSRASAPRTARSIHQSHFGLAWSSIVFNQVLPAGVSAQLRFSK